MPECPYCYSSEVEYETIDIGVGSIQSTPAFCLSCGAYEMNPAFDLNHETFEWINGTVEEKKNGWYKTND